MSEGLRGAPGAELEAQAKVNLRLRILAREAGGYHQLETLFLRLALADTVRVRLTPRDRSLDVTGVAAGTDLGPVESNLAWRAAAAYVDAARLRGGFAIELEKRIPVGGGLGGGSADAGAVLRVLDAISPEPLGPTALLQLAAALGADVPFLTSGHAFALAWSRGERLLPLPPPPAREVLLVVPPFAVNTAAAYGWLAAARARALRFAPVAALLDPDRLRDWTTLASLAVNDFEPVVAERFPEIDRAVAWLAAQGCQPALMSGSGSVVFGVLPHGARGAETAQWPGEAGGMLVRTATATRVAAIQPLHDD